MTRWNIVGRSAPCWRRSNRWVREGVAPPPSLHPMLADRTAVPQNEIKFPNVPGSSGRITCQADFATILMAGPTSVLPFLVPRADKDGNVISGLRLPEQSVPLGTYGGWAFRSESYGQSDTLVSMADRTYRLRKRKPNGKRPAIRGCQSRNGTAVAPITCNASGRRRRSWCRSAICCRKT